MLKRTLCIIMLFVFTLEKMSANNLLLTGKTMVLNEKLFFIPLQNYLSENLLISIITALLLAIFGLLLYIYRKKNNIQNSSRSWKEFSELISLLSKDKKVEFFSYDIDRSHLYKYHEGAFVTCQKLEDYIQQVHPDDRAIVDSILLRLKDENRLTSALRYLNQENQKYEYNEFVIAVAKRDLSGQAIKIYFSRIESPSLNEIISNQQGLINDFNFCLEAGRLIRWTYDLSLHKSRVVDNLGNVYEFDNSMIDHVSEVGRVTFLKYLLSLIKGGKNLKSINLWVYSEYHKTERYYRLRANLENDIDDKPIKIHGIWYDITEEHIHDDKLSKIQKSMGLALEIGKIETWIYDCSKKIYTLIHGNPIGINNSKGMTYEDFHALVHPEDTERIEEIGRKILNKEIDSANYKFRINTEEGCRWIHNSCIPIIENEEVISIIGVSRDITDKIEYQEMLNKDLADTQRDRENLIRVLDSLQLPIALINLQDGSYTYTNKRAKDIYLAIEGSKPTYKILDTTLEGDVEEIERIKASAEYEADEKLLFADGRIIETRVKSIPIRYKSVDHALVSRIDFTKYNEAKQDSKLLSNFMPPLKAYTWTFSTLTNIFITRHNEILERKYNGTFTPDEFMALIHPDDRPLLIERIMGLVNIEEETSFSIQFRMDIEVEGVYEWWEGNYLVEVKVEKGVKFWFVSGITMNIDQKKKAELELKKLNQDIELILNNANSLLAYVTPKYEIIWSNADTALNGRLEELYNAGIKSCLGYGCLTKGHEGACDMCPIRTTLVSGVVSEKEFLVQDNVWLKTTAVPILCSEGKPNGVILKIDDVSEYKRLIEDLEFTTAKAEESDKLKSAFLANMSHEIRTPLNAIVGFSELLQTSDEEDEKEEYIRIINANNDLLLRLIGDILDLSKIESGLVELHPEAFDFSSFFSDSYSTLKPRCERSEVKLKYYNPYDKIIVSLDRNRMLQIVTNYLNNAVKFTQHGEITMGYSYKDGGLEIFVRDTGIGIAKEKMNLLFQRFEKLDDFAQGTGLGLSICKAIAKRMGGRVWAESEVGKGSAFFAWIPCEADIETKTSDIFIEERSLIDDVSEEEILVDKMKNILVVEDNNSNYLLIKAILKNCHLTRAFNGEEAVAYVKQFQYDVVLMDLKMPIMGGLKATKKIREFDSEIVIVAITANAFESDKEEAIQSGCNAFIPKPINRADLEAIIYGS